MFTNDCSRRKQQTEASLSAGEGKCNLLSLLYCIAKVVFQHRFCVASVHMACQKCYARELWRLCPGMSEAQPNCLMRRHTKDTNKKRNGKKEKKHAAGVSSKQQIRACDRRGERASTTKTRDANTQLRLYSRRCEDARTSTTPTHTRGQSLLVGADPPTDLSQLSQLSGSFRTSSAPRSSAIRHAQQRTTASEIATVAVASVAVCCRFERASAHEQTDAGRRHACCPCARSARLH